MTATESSVIRFLILLSMSVWLILSETKKGNQRSLSASTVVGLFSLVTGFFYSMLTSVTTRGHDVGGHAEYVEYLRTFHSLPPITHGWETYQPPLYYLCVLGLEKVGITAQDFSFLIFSFSLVLFVIWLKRKNLGSSTWVAVGWIGLLPACTFYSSRLNNDVPFLLYGVLFLRFYDQVKESKHKKRACISLGILCAVALMTKMSGVVFVWAMIPLILVTLIKFEWMNFTLLTLPSSIFLLLWSVRSFNETGSAIYMNTVGMPTQLYISNGIDRFSGFNVGAYFHQISADPWGGVLRDQVGPYLLVTALQGEFPYLENFTKLFIVERTVLLFILVTIPLILLLKRSKNIIGSGGFYLVAAQFVFFIILCSQNAFAPIQDARYWAAAYPAIGYLFAATVDSVSSPKLKSGYHLAFAALYISFAIFYWKLLGT